MKMNPNSAKKANATEMLPAVKRMLEKTPTSSIGWSLRRSHRMNAVNSTAARAKATRLVGDVQPCFGPSITAHTSTVTPAIDKAIPSGSKRRIVVSRDVGTTRQMAIMATTITGTLTMNTEPQKKCSSRNPPVTGPRATARPLVAAQIEMAIARCRASVNTFTSSANVAGKINAAPTPIAARQPIS